MMITNMKLLILLFTIININLFILAKDTKLAPTFGVNPEVISYYKGKTFSCLASNKEIPIEQVNDDYCDCPDGTDEPGTSACAKGTYYCINKGYKPTSIPTSFLNDAVCDCCDGSDEYKGKIKCPNTCNELGKELRDKRQKDIDNFTVGLGKKSEMESESKDILKQMKEDLERLKKEIDPLSQEIKEISTRKDAKAQERDNEVDIINKQNKVEDQNDQQQQEQQEQQQEQQKDENKPQGEELNNSNEENQPEEQKQEEEVVTSPALEAIKKGNDININNNIIDKDDDEKKQVKDDNDSDDSISSQILSLIFDIYPMIWDLIKDFLPSSIFKADDLDSLEKELSSKRESLRSKQEEIDDIEKLLTFDFGTNNVFLPLHGKCFDVKTKEYTYTFCPYDKANQGGTSLGKFEKWENDHSKMVFSGGQKCWNGPSRSLTVSFECGQENEAYGVEEPGKCEYTMKFKTPASCDEEHLKILKLDINHEL